MFKQATNAFGIRISDKGQNSVILNMTGNKTSSSKLREERTIPLKTNFLSS